MTTSQVTELEGAALAVISTEGGCTAYRVKRAFEQSPSAFWSGSAGAVYPMVARLVRRGLLAESAKPLDGRGKRTVRITKAGRRALNAWFGDLDRATAPGFDPLRTRLNLTDAVPESAFVDLMGQVEAELRKQLDDPPAPPGPGEARAKALYRMWLEARLEWIAKARKAGLL